MPELKRYLPTALPIATPIALPVALPIATPIAEQLTNIDTTNLAAERERYGLPVAERIGEPGRPIPDPLWIPRWQPTATVPPEKGPWVIAYRWWLPNGFYQSFNLSGYFRIDLWFKPDSKNSTGHQHAYLIKNDKYREFRELETSVGQWLHDRILGNRNANGTYPHSGCDGHFPLN